MPTTPRDNLLRTLRRQGFEWVPVDVCGFCHSQVEAFKRRFGHTDYFGWFKVPYRPVAVNLQAAYRDAKALYPRETLPAETDVDVWGVGHSHQPGCFHMTHMHHPLAGDVTVDDIQNYPLPCLAPTANAQLKSAVEQLHRQGLAAFGSMACTLWEIAWYIRSMEDLMADMMANDERATVHFDKIVEISIARIRAYARADADIIQLGDDIGMQSTIMMSMELWRKWLKPRLARIIAAAREVKPDILIFYHSCGYVIPFLDELIEVGVDILNPIQPECMEFGVVHQRTAGRLSYWGTIGTQTTLPFGKPAEVKEVVWSRLKTCGKAGGIVIGPTHLVEPEVPWENLAALAEAAAEFKL
ncbi:MAG: uroporphyrinogen decarboxylase family protein [Verrucomicrobiota bacterium]